MKTFWLFGLSGSGKTTISKAVSDHINYINLDGDIIRKTNICSGLTFTESDRLLNIKRIIDICNIINQKSSIIVSAITPYNHMRKMIKEKINDSYLIYINAPLAICEKRDTKGLYKKARENKLKNFTGISNRFDTPNEFDLEIKTDILSIDESMDILIDYINNEVL